MNRHQRTLAACLASFRGGSHPTVAGPSLAPVGRRPSVWWMTASPDPSPATDAAVGHHLRTDEMARVEAALFLAREPLTTRRLAKLARLPDGTRARTLVRELRRLQDSAGVRSDPGSGGCRSTPRLPGSPPPASRRSPSSPIASR